MKAKKTWRYLFRFLCSFFLVALATGSFAITWHEFVKVNNQTGHLLGHANLLMSFLIYAGLFTIICNWMGAFRIGVIRKSRSVASLNLGIITTNLLEVFASMAITGEFRFVFAFLRLYFFLSIGQILVLSVVMILMINLYWGVVPPTNLLVIEGCHGNHLVQNMTRLKHKYVISKAIPENLSSNRLVDEMAQAEAVLINDVDSQKQNDIVKACFYLNKRVYVVPKLSDIILKTSEHLNVVDTPLYLCRNLGMSLINRIIKRAFDVSMSLLGIIITFPLWIVVSIAIKLEDHGPVFFKQERVTRDEKRFLILKFRSMRVDAEQDGVARLATKDDARITGFGHFIRNCRIDELPQLFNILKGDMSFIGPRPERPEILAQYLEVMPEFAYRMRVKAGLAGYAQVYGKYNTTPYDKLKLDLTYIENYSVWLDLKLMLLTLRILFTPDATEGVEEEQITALRANAGTEEAHADNDTGLTAGEEHG